MIRRAILFLLSIAAVTTGLLWVYSYHSALQRRDRGFASIARLDQWQAPGQLRLWGRPRSHFFVGLMLDRGTAAVRVDYDPEVSVLTHLPQRTSSAFIPASCLGGASRKWFDYGNVQRDGTEGSCLVVFAFWLPFAILVVYPVQALIYVQLRRWRRKCRGLCLNCGYDLIGSPEPRCPECGKVIE